MFSINTNTSAITAMNKLNSTKMEIGKSMTRLSTGLRINGASDDPSGLIAVKRMSAQIASMGQAQSNTQDAINYSKTADGALDEVNTLLQDARTLAIASGNTATLTPDQLAANQSQLQSIVASVTRISSTTQYGTKRLLDGSAGTSSAVTDGTKLSAISIGGTFSGKALSANSTVTMSVSTAAEQAMTTASATFASASSAVGTTNAGSFTINGTTFTATATMTASELVSMVNKASDSTGVTASFENNAIQFRSSAYGDKAKIDIVDSTAGLVGTGSDTGVNAVATVTVGGTDVTFTGGQNGADGRTLSDADGNTIQLTSTGNATGAAASVGQVVVGQSQFQIGANAGQTAQLSIGNFAASELGKGSGGNATDLTQLNLTTDSGATDALKIIDKAISDVTTARGRIGNFQKNVLETNSRTLSVAKENLTATKSTIEDVDVAEEMTNYTKLQILQSTGMAILAQAKSAPQAVLQLLQG